MPGLIIGGREVPVPGVPVVNFKDNPKLSLRVGLPNGNNDGKRRTRPVTLVVLHTTKGIPGGKDKREQVIRPGKGPDTRAEDRTASFWSTDSTQSGAHIVIDHDCSVGCLADLQDVCAYHAGQSDVNDRSVGIEIYQGHQAELYDEQLETVRKVVDALTIAFGIQRQIPDFYRNRPVLRLEEGGGKDVVGVVGHRDCSDNRGKGDPGDAIFDYLEKAGYERFDFHGSRDLDAWKERQKQIRDRLGRQIVVDGIPGTVTLTALKELGYQHGLWALPPKSDTGSDLVASILDGYMPLFLSMFDDKSEVYKAVGDWARKGKSS
jgi:N-acetyl-anhydromuramyl-L-alanine amidase AmpD